MMPSSTERARKRKEKGQSKYTDEEENNQK
jgi:hypothetical protein